MRSDRHGRATVRALALVLAGGCVMTFAQAQQPPAAPPAATSSPAPAKSDEDANDAPATPATTPPPKKGDANDPKPAGAKGSPQHFEPSEKVRPDFDVAFPVDI